MSPKQRFYLVFIALLAVPMAFAQVQPQAPTKKDSAAFYRKIEKYSKKRKFTSFVHGLIFEPVTPKTLKARKKAQTQRFKAYQGKVIRKINIVTLDPFGYSESDSTKTPQKRLADIGNRFHLKTKRLTVWNLLLIKRNKPLDSLLVKESERLIRAQRFVRRVLITPKAVATSNDSVDIDIRVLDSWSLVPDFAASSSKTKYQLTERNFLGLGHQVRQSYEKDLTDGDNAYSARYTIPNIMNTYIRSDFDYDIDLDQNYRKSINIERPFFSPYARWAAGFLMEQQFRRQDVFDMTDSLVLQNFKFNNTDIWAGHAIQIFKGSSEDERTTNLITSLRYQQINFTEKPIAMYDSIQFYANERNYFAGIGVTTRQFVEDKYIFNYGIVEDVPVGKAFGITAGIQEKNHRQRMYLGARITSGKYYKWGFFGANLEMGSFYHKGDSEQSAVSLQTNYFTNLYELGKWKFRQFIKAQVVIGNDRAESWGDMLSLEGQYGIQGFDSSMYFGTKKWLVTAQTQSYAPWDLIGFRLNPFLGMSMGMLGDSKHGFSKSKAYSQIGIGVLISNDFLVFSTFQISFSYFPSMPDTDSGLFQTNTFNTTDFGLMDFAIAKPETVFYR